MKKLLVVVVMFMVYALDVYGYLITDFDNIKRASTQFKDDKGSLFYFTTDYEQKYGNVLKFEYDIVPGGWGGWICMLGKVDVSEYEFLSLEVKGGVGGEKFEIGIKDTTGKEKKVQTEMFTQIDTKWKIVQIPLEEFEGVDFTSLENLSFAVNDYHKKGLVYVDNIEFVGKKTKDKKVGDKKFSKEKLVKVLIDGFERTNPYDFYKIWTADNSSLKLESSRLVYEGDYSMGMEYVLSTDKPIGSNVSIRYDVARPFNWSGVRNVSIYIKGDGTDNIFRIQITDKDDEVWYAEEKNILKSTKWQQLKFDIDEFKLYSKTGNGEFDLDEIQSYEFIILSKYAGSYSGKIYVDQFFVEGIKIIPEEVSIPGIVEKLKLAVPTVGNIYLSGFLYNEYLNTPEEGGKITHWAKITADGRVDNYSARVELASNSQSFSEASYVAYDYENRIYTVTQSPGIIVPNIQFMINNLTPFLTNITLGNVWFTYSKYTFVIPGWGFKGITAEGDIKRLNYHLFYLTGPYNSYTAGTRLIGYLPNTRISLYSIFSYESAKSLGTSISTPGKLQYTTTWDIKSVSDDVVYNLELWRWFLDQKVGLQLIYGTNRFVKYATADYSDAYYPVYNTKLEPNQIYSDEMYYGKVDLNNLIYNGINVSLNYRNIGTEYKPKFRDNPAGFDDSDTDQKGYNIRGTYFWQGISLSAEYDDIIRLSNSSYFRRRNVGSIGYYGFRGIDVSYYLENRVEKYKITSSRTGFVIDKGGGEEVNVHQIYVRNQLTPKVSLWFILRKEFLVHLNNVSTDMLFNKIEYFLSPNARMFFEYKTTRYPETSWEPVRWPFDDNYLKLNFEFTF